MRKSRVIYRTPRTTPWTQNVSTSLATPSTTWPCERKSYGGIVDFDAKFERLRTVNASLEDPSVWNDPKKAQELGKEKKSLDGVVLTLDKLTRELADNTELYDMSKEEGDEAGLMTIEAETAKRDAAQAADRKLQVGSGDRSQRIRTYSFPQGRITDHRVEGLTLYDLPNIIEGDLGPLVLRLQQERREI